LKFFKKKLYNKSFIKSKNTINPVFLKQKLSYKNLHLLNHSTSLGIQKKNYWFNNFVAVLLKKGLKKKLQLSMSVVFMNIINTICNNKIQSIEPQKTLEIYYHNMSSNKNNATVNFFLSELLNLLNPAFNLKLGKQNKKKKKVKSKYMFSINYIFPQKRSNIVFKWLNMYSNYFVDKKFSTRLFKSLFYTYLEKKNSFLYIRKLEMYNQYLQSKKKN